jgi:hypothetical protein
MSQGKGSMRDAMPVTTAFIDNLRSQFGREYIDDIIRRGMRGEPLFSASENGHTIGTPEVRGVRIGRDARGNCINLDDPSAGKEPMRVCMVEWPDPEPIQKIKL